MQALRIVPGAVDAESARHVAVDACEWTCVSVPMDPVTCAAVANALQSNLPIENLRVGLCDPEGGAMRWYSRNNGAMMPVAVVWRPDAPSWQAGARAPVGSLATVRVFVKNESLHSSRGYGGAPARLVVIDAAAGNVAFTPSFMLLASGDTDADEDGDDDDTDREQRAQFDAAVAALVGLRSQAAAIVSDDDVDVPDGRDLRTVPTVAEFAWLQTVLADEPL